jgi:Rieske Fe-S protein
MNSSLSGTLTTAAGQPAIRCNCHGSIFRADGSVAKGPAYNALAHFALTLECDGHLYVNTEQSVGADERLGV